MINKNVNWKRLTELLNQSITDDFKEQANK